MKVYIVELWEYDGYKRFGVYSTLELARKELNKIFKEECNFIKNYEEYSLDWINENHFVVRFNGSVHENYLITEVEVE